MSPRPDAPQIDLDRIERLGAHGDRARHARDEAPASALEPEHLEGVGRRIRFAKPLGGPVAIGSGRHRGMGVFAAV